MSLWVGNFKIDLFMDKCPKQYKIHVLKYLEINMRTDPWDDYYGLANLDCVSQLIFVSGKQENGYAL
jgi:hypothetical protein